jgi:hypothetical protein
MMSNYLDTRTKLFRKLYTHLGNDRDFISLALEIFRFQYAYNPVYRQFADLLGCRSGQVNSLASIPFMPVGFFRNHEIRTGKWEPEREFRSSTTTGQVPSRHLIRSVDHYNRNATYCFEQLIGGLPGYRWYGLLPHYLRQGQSSLVHMVQHFMQAHPDAEGGFYLEDFDTLIDRLHSDRTGKVKVLIGVSYALLDLAENHAPNLEGVLIIETGGMKGRGREMPKEELYDILKRKFRVPAIQSEYGMAELMSQAYSRTEGILECPPTMRIEIAEINDPFHFLGAGQQGRINVVDLANLDSCCFIATDDLGERLNKRQFIVSGRSDASEMRGCNLLYTGDK